MTGRAGLPAAATRLASAGVAAFLKMSPMAVSHALLACSLLAACYSFSGSTLPGHLRTIRIPPVDNRTLEPELADRVTRGLEEGFRRRSNLRRVNENGDALLLCTLTDYSHRPQTTSGDVVTSYRVDMLLSVLFIDRVKGDTLYKDDRVPGFGQYFIERGQTEDDGQRMALESLVKVVLDNTVSAW
jgi:hypothetical protein